MDSEENEVFYSGDIEDEGDDYGYSDDGDCDDYMAEASDDDLDESVSARSQQNYITLTESDIRQRQEDDITRVSTVLSISKSEAIILLRQYNWSVSKVHDEWFADEEAVRGSVGVLNKPVVQHSDARELSCGICFEYFHHNKITSAACGHLFCRACWSGYISTTVKDGPGCLMLRCPIPSCQAAIGQDMINSLASDEDKEKYSRYLLRSYIEDNRKTKWCPAPGCEYAVGFAAGDGSFDVSCLCSYSFCWNTLSVDVKNRTMPEKESFPYRGF